MKKLINFINWIKIYWKGDKVMMIIFLTTRVVLGKLAYVDVPEVLKPAVKQELEDNGLGFLAVEEYTELAELLAAK